MRNTTESIIKRAVEVHNNLYTYSNATYIGYHKPITITCNVHGDFDQRVADHLAGKGCRKCQYKNAADKQRFNTNEFVIKAKSKHGDKFDYSKVVYTTARNKITIVCPVHGEFEQIPDTHLRSVYGCIKCSQAALGEQCRSNTKEFIKKAKKVHGEAYDYSNVDYVTAIKPVTIKCMLCNLEFYITPKMHLNGCGCSCSSSGGFDKRAPAILYYLKVLGGQAYKIGITNKTVKDRFTNSDLEKIEIIKIWEYQSGKEAYDAEQLYIKEYKQFKYAKGNILSSGNTELFYCDVLLLDKYSVSSTHKEKQAHASTAAYLRTCSSYI
jgi:hypothetical protein